MQNKNGSYDLTSQSWDAPLPSDLDSENALVLVFGAPELTADHPVLAEIKSAFPTSKVVGCSSAGEIHGTEVRDNSISLSVSRFQNTTLRSVALEVDGAEDSNAAGQRLAEALAAPNLRAIFILSEGLQVNGSELVRGVNAAAPGDVVVTGGLSGDGARFEKTWVLADGKLRSGVVAAVGFYGDHVVIRHGSLGGWDMFGPERSVTRSEGNVLFEIDGKPALDLYKKYLGPKAKDLPGSGLLFPLSMRRADDPSKFLVRTLLAVDEDAKSMTFAGDLPQAATVQLMKANFERLIEGASGAADAAKIKASLSEGSDVLAIAVSCVGRRLVLGERTDEELEAIEEQIPGLTHITGFYSYGELSPFATGSCDLHNQTMTLTTFAESATPIIRSEAGMHVRSASYEEGEWSAELPVELDSERTLVTVLGASSFGENPAEIVRIQKAFPKSIVVGCSSAGEIHGTEVKDESLSLSVAKFNKTTLAVAEQRVADASQSHAVGVALATNLLGQGSGLRAVFVLSEGLGVNGSELVGGLNSALPENVVVTGGLSGDGARFEKTWVATHDTVASGLVVAVGFYGDHVVVRHGSLGGWDMFGPERTVTRSEGNVLFEIDGKPALDLYKQYLGPKARDLPGSGLLFPLSMRRADDPSKFLVRTLLAVDEDAKSMTFAGDLPQGATVQLMKANFERLIEGASGAAQAARVEESLREGSDVLAIAVSCVGRRLVLGERTDEELEAIEEQIPGLTHITGFYSYGELSPFATGSCDLHNQTMTLTTFAESRLPVSQAVQPTVAPIPDLTSTDAGAPERVVAPPRKRSQDGAALEHFSFDLESCQWSSPVPTHLDSDRTMLLVFGAPEFRDAPEAIQRLRQLMPKSHLIGCSTAGEIHGTDVRDHSLSVTAFRFEHTELYVASRHVRDANESYAAGQDLARELMKYEGLRAAFVLSEGLNVNGSELVRGLNGQLPVDVVVTGGLSGDGANFEKTWVVSADELCPKLIVALGFYGDHLVVQHGSKGGWDKFGPERTITKSTGNVVYELDGKPALDLYKQYLGPKAEDLPGSGLLFPFAVRAPSDKEKVLVRTLLAVDEEDQSLTFAGDVPQGHVGQLMKANFDRLVTGSSEAAFAATLTGVAPEAPVLAIAVSCVGRRLVLGERTEEEIEAIETALPEVTQITGFYSYGELSPFGTGSCDLHNQTMTLTVFGEADAPVPRVVPAKRVQPSQDFTADPSEEVDKTVVFGASFSNDEVEEYAGWVDEPVTNATSSMFDITQDTEPEEHDSLLFDAFADESSGDSESLSGLTGELQGPKETPGATPTASPPTASPPRNRLFLQQRAGGAAGNAGVQTDITQAGDFMIVSMSGRLTESFSGAQIGQRLSGRVVFDMHGVDRITSFGVREWLTMLDRMEVKDYYFARCSEAIINQVAMIRNFCGTGQITSFFAPYLCGECGDEFSILYDAQLDGALVRRHQSVSVPCPRCQSAAALDDDPWSYFSMAGQLASNMDDDLMIALGTLPKLGSQADPIEKLFEGRTTTIRFNTRLDASIRLRRVFDGLEGEVIIDLTHVPAATLEGSDNFRRSLLDLEPEVTELKILACPQVLLERIIQEADNLQRVKIESAHVEVRCSSPTVSRFVLVDIGANRANLLAGRDPVVRCDWCEGQLDWSESMTLLKGAAKLGQKAALADMPVVAPVAAVAPAPAPVPVTVSNAPPAPQGPSATTLVLVLGGIAAIAFLGLAIIGYTLYQPTPATATAAAMVPPPAIEATAVEVATGWQTDSKLPPAWAERAFVESGDKLLIVGQAPGANAEEGLDAARTGAVYVLVQQLRETLKGSDAYAFLDSAKDDHALTDSAAQGKVVDAFLADVGTYATPERSEVAVRQDEDGVFVAAQYSLTADAFDKARTHYAASSNFRGLTIAPTFPTLVSRLGTDGKLVIVSTRRWVKSVHAGDLVHKVSGKAVYSVAEFKAESNRVWSGLKPGASMSITVSSNGLERDVLFSKPMPRTDAGSN